MIETLTSTVTVSLALSVTVHRAVPLRSAPLPMEVAVNEVVALDGELMVMPLPPLSHVQA